MTGPCNRNARPQTVVYDGRFIPSASAPASAGTVHLRSPRPATIRLFDAGGIPSIRGIEVRVHLDNGVVADIIAHSYDASSPASLAHESYAVSRASRFNEGGDSRVQARYRIHPFIGGARIEPNTAALLPENFLFEELDTRLAYGPVMWRLLAHDAGGAPVELGTIALESRVADHASAEGAGTR